MPASVVLVTHPACAAHDTGPDHLESAARLASLRAAVEADPALAAAVERVEPQPAEEADLLRAHSPAHLALLRDMAARAGRAGRIDWVDPDTAVCGASFAAALASAGCALTAAELVATGRAGAALAACRPPGHHAGPSRAGGFCLFNNAVVAARRLQARGLARRVLIVDWDVHHGDGTQELVWDDPSLALLSLHLFPHYPETGSRAERGSAGTVWNVPLDHGTGRDAYREAFSGALREVQDRFAPELVLVSSGFDCLAGDPLGGLPLEPADLHALTLELRERTRPSAGGRVVAILEGGYAPARVGQGARAVLRALAGLAPPTPG